MTTKLHQARRLNTEIVGVTKFRDNVKAYLSRAKTERIIIHNNSGSFVIMPIEETDITVSYNPEWEEMMKKSQQQAKEGKVTRIKTEDLWK